MISWNHLVSRIGYDSKLWNPPKWTCQYWTVYDQFCCFVGTLILTSPIQWSILGRLKWQCADSNNFCSSSKSIWKFAESEFYSENPWVLEGPTDFLENPKQITRNFKKQIQDFCCPKDPGGQLKKLSLESSSLRNSWKRWDTLQGINISHQTGKGKSSSKVIFDGIC